MMHLLDRSMSLIEIGPSHRPLVAKRDGWRTTIVDHASRADLVWKYAAHPVDVEAIEEVDVVWSGGDLASLFPAERLGTYDAILASHVLEHMPDPISFLMAADVLLSATGVLVLAVPDRRYSFDFFAPMTSTADWLTAYTLRARSHSKRAAFNHVAYAVSEAGQISWRHAPLRDLGFVHTLGEALHHFETATDSGEAGYVDYHAWRFTPSSLELVLLETFVIHEMDFHVAACSEPLHHEFFVTIVRGARLFKDDVQLQEERMRLLTAMIGEAGGQASLLPTPSGIVVDRAS